MKRSTMIGIAVVAVMALLVATASVALAQGGGNGRRGQGGYGQGGQIGGMGAHLPPASNIPLTEAQVKLITDGLMDEYNAYNAYQLIINQFGAIRPFTNIQRAEAQHIEAWKVIFSRYAVTLPSQPALGEATQYTTAAEACKVAADLEQSNIKLYDEMLAAFSAYPDITQVITALRSASLNSHLPALTNCAAW